MEKVPKFYKDVPEWKNEPEVHELTEENLTPEQLKKMGVEVPNSGITFRNKEGKVIREVDHHPNGMKKVDVEFDPETGRQKHIIFFNEEGLRIREGFYDVQKDQLDHWFEYNPKTGEALKHGAQIQSHPEFLKKYLRSQPWGKDTDEFRNG